MSCGQFHRGQAHNGHAVPEPEAEVLPESVSKKCFDLDSTDHEMDHRDADHGFTRVGDILIIL